MLYITPTQELHDDADGFALSLPTWPKDARIATQSEIDAILNPPISALEIKEQHNFEIQQKIEEKESDSLRALREAILYGNKTELLAIDKEITLERSKLDFTL